jgi:NTE family protein
MGKTASKDKKKKAPPVVQKKINLALQGGGAHGAFTWGVLDALLEDGRLDIEAISATSAGAMNAAALAHGKTENGAEGARQVLHDFWYGIAHAGAFFGSLQKKPMENMMDFNPMMQGWAKGVTSSYAMFDVFKNMFSPYQFNPLNINPLKSVLQQNIDLKAVHACDCVELFISATNIRTGDLKIFRNKEVTIDALLASACLPFLFQAVEIGNDAYWDGGYMGNPALWPLFYNTKSRDILIVHVNPMRRPEIPQDAYDIENRLNEITFNGSLLKELRAIAFVQKLIREDMLKDEYKDQYKDILLHAIRADKAMGDLSIASKFDTDWGFLTHLRDLGRDEAKKWLKNNYEKINHEASVDIERDYLRK